MQVCPFCGRVYDESQYPGCPICERDNILDEIRLITFDKVLFEISEQEKA